MKTFLITIDTEGDNLWDWKPGDKITTENTLYLQRFQDLAEKYGFKPVWLTNYEMISDKRYLEFIQKVEEKKTGELGMHLHAWSTPPEYTLPIERDGAPYLIEYPTEIMEEKIKAMTSILKEKTGIQPVSHRAGRWAMDDRYFALLEKYGYEVDCSVTPHMNWSNKCGQTKDSQGSDYSACPEKPYKKGNVLEVPVNIRISHKVFPPRNLTPRKIVGTFYHALQGQDLWLRPNGYNRKEMTYLLDKTVDSDSDYIMFMLHSSEMMPGGSPTFKTAEDIESMLHDTEEVFRLASKNFEGKTLRTYSKEWKKKNG